MTPSKQRPRLRPTLITVPVEIQIAIFFHTTESSFALLLTHTALYQAAIRTLYHSPFLDSTSFPQFANRLTRANGRLVRDLDLSAVIHTSKPSALARVLHRCSPSIRYFAACQAAFPFLPIRILESCLHLVELDLSQICSVVDLPQLCDSISALPHLEYISFPRCSIVCDKPPRWPPKLESLSLAGGISDAFILNTDFPRLRYFAIQHAPNMTEFGLTTMLSRHGQSIVSLKILYPLPRFSPTALDDILPLVPNLVTFRFSVDYASRELFRHGCLLKKITFDSSGSMGTSRKIYPDDIALAMRQPDGFTTLKYVSVHARLGWTKADAHKVAELCRERDGELKLLNR